MTAQSAPELALDGPGSLTARAPLARNRLGSAAPNHRQRARVEFLRTGRAPNDIRPVIAQSWLRCLAAGFDPDASHPVRVLDGLPQSALHAAVDHEVVTRMSTLRRVGLTALLIDRDAVVIGRWDGARELHVVGDPGLSLPGISMAEAHIGTHAGNVALETLQPSEVLGHEHLSPRYVNVHSASLSIIHPGTQRLVGSLTVECSVGQAGALLLPWVSEVVQAVRSRLHDAATRQEMLLMRNFIEARSDGRRPVICLNHQTLLCNAAASRLLGSDDQAVLWEHASRVLRGEADATTTLSLGTGDSYEAQFDVIMATSGPIGARIVLRPQRRAAHEQRARRRTAVPPGTLTSLPGQSRRWRQFLEDLCASLHDPTRIVLVGDAGVGKKLIASTLMPDTTRFVDASCDSDPLSTVRQFLMSGEPMVIAHVEALTESSLSELQVLASELAGAQQSIICTFSVQAQADGLLDQLNGSLGPVVRVPALRDRLEDLPELVQRLTIRHTPAGREPVRWMADALQTLARVDWVHNVRSLESVVRQVTKDSRNRYVDSRGLPESVRAQAAGRRLSRLEQLEATEILASLRDSRGNKFEAAQRLGIARSTLYRRMRSLGMDLATSNY